MPFALRQLMKPGDSGDAPLSLLLPLPGDDPPSYLIGRKEGAIVLANDKSISRRHAELSVADGRLFIKDLDSKFGTFINTQRLWNTEPTDAASLAESQPLLAEEPYGHPGGRRYAVPHGAKLKVGTTSFLVEHVPPLVVCASGMSGDAKATHKVACERLGAAQAKEWREDVTHLVTPMMQWTPKFLYALGSLVPVVNPLWLHDASTRAAISDPLPDVNDAKYAPTPPAGTRAESGLDARVGCVNAARARLLSGVRLLCLPPTAPHPDSLKLIALMGGEAVPWDGPALDGPDAAAHATRRAQEGYGFLIAIGLPSDDRG